MVRIKWSREEKDYCVQLYYLNNNKTLRVQRAYRENFHEENGLSDKCPTSDQIRDWVKRHEERHNLSNLLQQRREEKERRLLLLQQQHLEKQKYTETSNNKLSRTQWGRKTGENRLVRKESIDLGEQHQRIKWKQRDMKWSGPKPFNEKQKIEPIIEDPFHCYNYYYYEEPKEEVKPDKRQVLKEKYEGKVLELVESLNAHGHAARTSAFVSLRAELQRHAVHDLLAAHRATLVDHVSRALRRGKDAERKAAAAVAPLFAVQVGKEGTEQFVREVRPSLITTATDKSASLGTRTECCSSLAVLCYLMENDITEILDVMRMYESIFSGSYLKHKGSAKVSTTCMEEAAWHAAALDGWSLLLPLLSHNHALSLLNNREPSFARLAELLDAPSLEVRISAGHALAIAYESMSDDNKSDRANRLRRHVDTLLPRLTELARDSDRFRAKKDLKIQRATFRDILKYFEEGETPRTIAHIGGSRVVWSSWSGGAAYAALAGALGGALQVLAPRCVRLRAALALADDLPKETDSSAEETDQKDTSRKNKKLQRHLQNRAASKARNFTRNMNRDKRIAVLAN